MAMCDVAQPLEAVGAAALLLGSGGVSVLHAAGVLRDALVRNTTASHLAAVFAPKAVGAAGLHVLAAPLGLDAFVLFSSISSVLGNVGQSNYIAANCCMDTLARSRRAHAVAACTLQLPLVTGAGMGAETLAGAGLAEAEASAVGALSLDEYAALVSAVVSVTGTSVAASVRLPLSAAVLLTCLPDAHDPRFAELGGGTAGERAAPVLDAAGGRASDDSVPLGAECGSALVRELVHLPAAERQGHAMAHVLRAVHDLVDSAVSSLSADVPLLETGMDSLAATELSSRLRALTGAALPATLVFEQPTARSIAAHLLVQVGGSRLSSPSVASAVAGGSPTLPRSSLASAAVALQSASSRWPGGAVASSASRAQLLQAGGDAMTASPTRRWAAAQPQEYCRYGGFLGGAQMFDGFQFGLAPVEVASMDPQQRLLLESAYATCHGSGYRRLSLLGSDVGVYVGIEHLDWQLLHAMQSSQTALQRQSAYAASGEQGHVASGRVSFVLGLHGPCMSVNTACSSALVAVHSAASALRAAECSGALASGVKLVLLPFAVAGGVHALDGRSKSFDARADGYGRSEAVGSSFLGLRKDGGAVLCASAVQSDGRSASLAAPSGSAQSTLLRLALARGAMTAAELEVIQPQGLGSALADPIEMGAVMGVLGVSREAPLSVGCHKANIGHSEAPSGLVGLLVAHHVLCALSVACNAQLRALNPFISEPMRRLRTALALPTSSSMARPSVTTCGVTAFGVSGAIAHGILRSDGGGSWVNEFSTSVEYRRRAHTWCEPAHPLLERLVPWGSTDSADSAVTFRSAASGALFELVAEHVIQSRVVFPGAAYIEMARAACSASGAPASEGAALLRSTFFLQPLAVESAAALVIELSLPPDGQFEVRSGVPAAADASLLDVAVHCTGTVSSPSPAEAAGARRGLELPSRRAVCDRVADVALLYAAYDAVGLQYGPGFRSVERAWSHGDSGGATSSGRLRARSSRRVGQVHPADLDGALHLSALVLAEGGGETRLPFAVDEARLRASPSEQLWAVRSACLDSIDRHSGCVRVLQLSFV